MAPSRYVPQPIDISDVALPPELEPLAERLAENTHDVWSRERLRQGWRLGDVRNDERKEHPCLVAYDELPESEKELDRNTTLATLKAIIALGFEIRPPRR